MQICLVAANRLVHDPRARALAHSLTTAGHQVGAVAIGTPQPAPLPVTWIAPRRPEGWGRFGTALRRITPVQDRIRIRMLARAAGTTGAELLYPTTPAAISATVRAVGSGAAVAAPPGWVEHRDLRRLAPHHPELSRTGGGHVPFHHVPGWEPGPPPEPGRHRSRQVLLCYRRTDRNPGRYLEAALHRAGVDVTVADRLDWDGLDPATSCVVVVESPLPPLAVAGVRRPVPVCFWVHHGEHHLEANLRLARRYGADLVLLAHSWHLAHRFEVPVERFPFAVAPELFEAPLPWEERPFDLAFVGSHLAGGGPYRRRGDWLEALGAALDPDRVALAEGVTPEEMGRLYQRARVVVNEGGTRHDPLTMRVLEALGAGALLVSDPAPGLDLLFTPGRHYLTAEDDLVDTVTKALRDRRSATIASAGFDYARRHHTYDHRVDELFAVLERLHRAGRPPLPPQKEGLAGLIDPEPDLQRIVEAGLPDLVEQLPDREVWPLHQVAERLSPGTFQVAAIGADRPGDLERLITAATRLVVAGPECSGAVAAELTRLRPGARVEIDRNGLLRAEVGGPGYRG